MRITVLIATYNRADLVGEAVESVLAQTRPADEIIVIDDGSTDGTAARLAAFEGRIRVIAKANGGVSSARNAGLAAATGDWVTFLDDDDVWTPGRLAILERDAKGAAPEIAAHLANVRYVGEGYVYDVMEMYRLEAPKGSARRVEDIFATAARGLQMNGLAVRRAVIAEIGGFDESLSTHEDKLFSGLLAHGRPWLVTGDLVSDVRRVDAQSLTELSGRDMGRRLANMLAVNDRLLALGVTGRGRRLLMGTRHFLLMRQAALLLGAGEGGAARARLLEAARCHPSRLKGWLKVLPLLAFGRRGMRLLPVKRFDR
jgi:glycosyltransferase involved in cell wall biosynthesis